jgi:hypothetical protein
MGIEFLWPENLRPASVDWGLIRPQLVGRSTFDGSAQAITVGAPRWAFTISTGPLKFAEVPEWEAFIDRLDGRVNRVRAWDWRREQPLGPASGSPEVRVAGTGSTLQTHFWTPTVSGILRAGSYMQINGELKRLSETINSDGLGRATISFVPPLRAEAPAGAPLILSVPTARFMLVTERPSMEQRGSVNPGQTLSFEEDVS